MTRSSRHRMTRNAEEIAAAIVRWPADRQTEASVQQLAVRHLSPSRLSELRAEGINWQLVAEIVNRTVDAEFNSKVQDWDSRLELLRLISPASVCQWCSQAYQSSISERNHIGHITARVA